MKYLINIMKDKIGSKLPPIVPTVCITHLGVGGSLLPILKPLKYIATTVAPTFLVLSFGSLNADELEPIKTANQVGADLSLIYNHDPMVEQENFDLLDGFEVNLFAMEPMIENPVHMVWGPRGRLWVACSWSYPQLKPGQTPNDKIIILEDTDGDGSADKSTVFADGLYIPTGIELSNGGVYVAQTPDILFLKDTDGDDVADIREVALTGFGIEDSHHSISAWRRGPGGWIYFQEGIFLHTQVETPRGMVRNFNGGVYQYKPQTGELRVFANLGVGNPWGHVFDYWGQSFMVDNPRINYLTASSGNGGLKVKAMTLIQTEKQCGGDLVSGSHFPDELQGMLLSGRFKSRTVIRYNFVEDGSGYGVSVLEPLMSSKHPNFRPVDVKMGPDGAAYVADWYNPIINHGGHDFRDPRRDSDHGRIWRITAKNRPLATTPDLGQLSISELVAQLGSQENWVRHQAKLLLSERNSSEVATALDKSVGQLKPGEADYDHKMVEALWTYQTIEHINEAHLMRVLSLKSGHARAAGARLIRYWYPQLSNPIALIEKLSRDSFPRVRLEAVLAAGFIPDARALPAALVALDLPLDKFLDSALQQTTSALITFAQEGLQNGSLIFSRKEHRDFAMEGAGLGFEERLVGYLKDWSGDKTEASAIWKEISRAPTKKQIRLIARALTKNPDSIPVSHVVGTLTALSKIGRAEQVGSENVIKPLALYLDDSHEEVLLAAMELAGAWRMTDTTSSLFRFLQDEDQTLELRKAAAKAIGFMGQEELKRDLENIYNGGPTPQDRYLAAYGLITMERLWKGAIERVNAWPVSLDQSVILVAKLLESDTRGADPSFLIVELLSRQHGDKALVMHLKDVKIHPSVARIVTNYFNSFGVISQDVARIFRPSEPASLNARLLKENLDDLSDEVDARGNAERGEYIFRRANVACMSCHAIAGAGPKIGPDLVAVGASATTSYVVDSILRPNNAIAEHYENFSLLTGDGAIYVGALEFQNQKEIVIRDTASGTSITVPRNTIRQQTEMPSLMPSGLVDQLGSRQEFLDLAKFVSSLGRAGPFAASSDQVIRKWMVLAGNKDPGQLSFRQFSNQEGWTPAYGLVRGELPLENFSDNRSLFAEGGIQVIQAGAVKLNINSTAGLRLWVDGREVSDMAATLNLGQGRRSFLFLIDTEKRDGKGLRVAFENTGDKPARFQIETDL
jgi:putative heme-binding domain-containing protein